MDINFRYYKSERLITFIILLTAIFSYISHQIEESLVKHTVISEATGWIDTFSTLTLVSLAVAIVNNYGWKYPCFKWLVDMPDVNGRYEGKLCSSYKGADGKNLEMKCVLEVKQTASSIHIFAYFGEMGTSDRSSRSWSVSEQFLKEHNGLFKLYYIFSNESEVLKTQLSNHAGTAVLNYYPDKQMFDGHYYNQRMNIGTIQVEFKHKELLGRLDP